MCVCVCFSDNISLLWIPYYLHSNDKGQCVVSHAQRVCRHGCMMLALLLCVFPIVRGIDRADSPQLGSVVSICGLGPCRCGESQSGRRY